MLLRSALTTALSINLPLPLDQGRGEGGGEDWRSFST
jgi:hypothetical protein